MELASETLGITAKLDLLEGVDGGVVPVDTKKGRPSPGGGPWDPDAVQICAQVLLLREHGYTVERGELYYAETKQRDRGDGCSALLRSISIAAIGRRSRRFAGTGIYWPAESPSPDGRGELPAVILLRVADKGNAGGVLIVGFDPYLGLFHMPRYGRPALALDLAEEFRALLADSCVLTLINNREISASDFVVRAGAVNLTADGRRTVIRAWERRMTTSVTHPMFGYQVTYRRAIELQARILAAYLVGELPAYEPLVTR